MTDDKKHDDKDRKKLSDEEMEDVAGGAREILEKGFAINLDPSKKKPGGPDGDGKLNDAEKG